MSTNDSVNDPDSHANGLGGALADFLATMVDPQERVLMMNANLKAIGGRAYAVAREEGLEEPAAQRIADEVVNSVLAGFGERWRALCAKGAREAGTLN